MKTIRALNTISIIAISLTLAACGSSADTMHMDSMSSINKAPSAVAGGSIAGFKSDVSMDSMESYDYDYDYAEDSYQEEMGESVSDSNSNNKGTSANQPTQLYEDKLIYRCSMSIETMNYDETYSTLQSLLAKYECRIEHEEFSDNAISYKNSYAYEINGYTTNKVNTMTIRVPSKNYKQFVEENGNLGNVVNKSSTIENITQRYYDTTAQVDGLKKQLTRLQEMMDEARRVEDMIEINREITNVQNQINTLETEIRTMDMDTIYSYVTLTLTEVVEYTENKPVEKNQQFIDRLKNQISKTWKNTLQSAEDILFAIISLIPTLIILAIITVIVKSILKKKGIHIKLRRKQAKSKEQTTNKESKSNE